MSKTTTLFLRGKMSVVWSEWFELMTDSAKRFGRDLTHFAVNAKGLGTTKARNVAQFDEIREVVDAKEVKWLVGYSLPKGFHTAAFDYELNYSCGVSHVSLSVKDEFSAQLIDEQDYYLSIFRRLCREEVGGIFRVDETETPLLYVRGAVDPSNCISYELIRSITGRP